MGGRGNWDAGFAAEGDDSDGDGSSSLLCSHSLSLSLSITVLSAVLCSQRVSDMSRLPLLFPSPPPPSPLSLFTPFSPPPSSFSPFLFLPTILSIALQFYPSSHISPVCKSIILTLDDVPESPSLTTSKWTSFSSYFFHN